MKTCLVLMLALLFTGCMSYPKVVKPAKDQVTVVSNTAVKEGIIKRGLPVPPLLDRKYAVINYEYAVKLIKDLDWLRVVFDINFVDEGTDCDNFAKLFCEVAKIVVGKGRIKAELLTFTGLVKQKIPWGGVKAGGGHAIVVIMTDRGPLIVEPQNGRHALAKDYPNKVYKLVRTIWKPLKFYSSLSK